jgi:autotransporter strand-loop-strand O-heptosyltransferase
MGWFPYAAKFEKQHGCKLTVSMGAPIIDLFKKAYPSIQFCTPEELNVERYYATYRIGLFFDDWETRHQPCDFRLVGLHRTAGYILGVDPTEERPLLDLPDDTRPIPESYVVIATQSTTQSKYWNNVDGWRDVKIPTNPAPV